jgi:transposase
MLYAGCDLHANNVLLGIVDHDGKKQFKKRIANDTSKILNELEPFKHQLKAIAVESTYNWYWLVDALMDASYDVHLANPSAMNQYSGLKHCDDTSDAFWLADLLRLGILPEGYIYPREERPLRDLLRKRMHLTKLQTSMVLSLQNIAVRNHNITLNANKIKQLGQDHVTPLFAEQQELSLSAEVSKQTIDYLTRQIRRLENAAENKARLRPEHELLQTIPGVGKILSLVILLETGRIERFPNVGNYASYCRKVPSNRISNDKRKGSGNKKNGNKYLSWAFAEAAEYAKRYNQAAQRFYHRKLSQTHAMVARAALAHKLARAAYHVMRDRVAYDEQKMFA